MKTEMTILSQRLFPRGTLFAVLVLLTGLSLRVSFPAAKQSADSKTRGEQLAELHCSSCHLKPPPRILPADKWPFIIRWMGNYLGHRDLEGALSGLVMKDQIAPVPLITVEELKLISKYYVAHAPEKPLPQENKSFSIRPLRLFQSVRMDLLPSDSPLTTLIKIDADNQRLFVGDGQSLHLLAFSPDGTLRERHKVDSQPVSLTLDGESFHLTLIGDLERDRRKGQILYYQRDGRRYSLHRILARYYRTAHAAFADLTGDGLQDIVVSAFGDYDKGRFSWLENLGSEGYREHVLIDRSGAVKAGVHDFNKDRLPDLMVLTAQGRNELILILNQGHGRFQRLPILEQFPGFGYHSLELVDFNQDGHMDVITVNGNNMEMEDPPLRNYHGVRLYLNDGDLNFVEKFFYPMYGAIESAAADFDQDGDMDVAAISFFPDWSQPQPEGFVYLENQGNGRLVPYGTSSTSWGRWLRMDAGDLDADGDLDLVLGNAFILTGMSQKYQQMFKRRFKQSPPVLLLRNQLKGRGSASVPDTRK